VLKIEGKCISASVGFQNFDGGHGPDPGHGPRVLDFFSPVVTMSSSKTYRNQEDFFNVNEQSPFPWSGRRLISIS